MASVIKLMRSGGKVVGDVKKVLEQVEVLQEENTTLKTMVEQVVAAVVVTNDNLEKVTNQLRELHDKIDRTSSNDVIGKTSTINDGALDRFSKISIHEIKRMHGRVLYGWRGTKGWTSGNIEFYNKWDTLFSELISKGELPSSRDLKPTTYRGPERKELKGAYNNSKLNDLFNRGLERYVALVLEEMAKIK